MLLVGSPPRLRGTLKNRPERRLRFRITPAPAGNTVFPRSSRWLVKDHPRACGEHCLRAPLEFLMTGSPPRLRGTRTGRNSCRAGDRITPAPAGNTQTGCSFVYLLKDHPRACGEHASRRGGYSGQQGSPPRLRGTPLKNPYLKAFLTMRCL